MTTETQQGCPMAVEPGPEHKWLEKLVGTWAYEAECFMGPDQPAAKPTGTETVRSLGGLWAVGEATGEMPGAGSATTIITIGYDPQKKQFIGSFIASMMAHQWVYERGELDADGRVLTLHTEGPDMSPGAAPGTMRKYKDVIEFKSDDHRVMTSHIRGDDGGWTQIMAAEYRRKK